MESREAYRQKESLKTTFCTIKATERNPKKNEISYIKLKKLLELVKNLTVNLSKEWKLICGFIEISLIYCDASQKVYLSDHSYKSMMNYREIEDFSTLVGIIKKWLEEECHELDAYNELFKIKLDYFKANFEQFLRNQLTTRLSNSLFKSLVKIRSEVTCVDFIIERYLDEAIVDKLIKELRLNKLKF